MQAVEQLAHGIPGVEATALAAIGGEAANGGRDRAAGRGGCGVFLPRQWVFVAGCTVLAYGLWRSPDFKTVAAGVAIFLFGMLFLEEGFTAFTGGVLERILRRTTKGLIRSHLFGIATTSLMQSSSLVSVITISFLSAGLIGLAEGIGIIFGANLGTTTGAWLMAAFGMKVKISAYAMPMLVFGLILAFQKRQDFQGAGRVLAGLGFLFLGIHYMKEGFETAGSSFDLSQYALTGYQGLFIYAGLGVAATVVMQSSHATLLLTIAALASGQVTYENALALAIGANIGTTITAILGSLSAKVAGKRLALAHLIFNTVTALLAIAFISPFRWCVDEVAVLAGVDATDWTLKLAIFHTLFNLVGVAVMIPIIRPLVHFLETRVRPDEVSRLRPQHLNDTALQHPDTALQVLVQETAHLFDNAFEILSHGLNLHRHDILSRRGLGEVVAVSMRKMDIDIMEGYYGSIKVLYNTIVDFASRARAETRLSEAHMSEIASLLVVCRHVAEIVKNVHRMRSNINRHTGSSDEHMRRQYNAIRERIAEVLRTIFAIRGSLDEVQVYLALERLKEHLERDDIVVDGTIDRLVRQRLVTSEMATSLMNDSHGAHEIVRRLIEIAERMFIAEGTDLKTISSDMLLDEGDFSAIA